MSQPWLDPSPFFGVGHVTLDRLAQLLARRLAVLVLDDVAAHPDHLGERPVRDAFPVRQAAAAVPVHVLGQAVDVFLELPGEPRLADPGDPRNRDKLRTPILGGGMEELLDETKLSLATHERRLEARRALRPASAGDDSERTPEKDRLGLPLQLV